MVCVILSGEFEREVTVNVGTEDESALGELYDLICNSDEYSSCCNHLAYYSTR